MSMADQDDATAAVVEGLKRLYHTKLKPLEQTYMFGWFHSPPLTDSEFESKPQVLMCGQYSTGKTSVSAFVCLKCVCVFSLFSSFFGYQITYFVRTSKIRRTVSYVYSIRHIRFLRFSRFFHLFHSDCVFVNCFFVYALAIFPCVSFSFIFSQFLI